MSTKTIRRWGSDGKLKAVRTVGGQGDSQGLVKSFKTELNLNNKQRTFMAKHAGVARHAYNWGLAICIEAKEKGEKRPSAVTLHKR